MNYITKEFYENKKNQQKVDWISRDIASCLISTRSRNSFNISLAAYLLYKVSQYNNPFSVTIREFPDLDDDVRCLAIERFTEDTWADLLRLVARYSPEEFALTAVFPVNEFEQRENVATPESIIKLVHRILKVGANEKVADIGCGAGSYLISAALEEKDARYFGYEINVESRTIAMMRAELLKADIQVNLCDAFKLADCEDKPKFDKLFSNYPFGLKLRSLGVGAKYLEHLSKQCPGLSKATSSDWVFNALLCDLLGENGKAIGIMTNGSTWNSIDTLIRKYFVERKMVECVITLPNKMFSNSAISTTLIVFSHNNDAVRMIDATDICQWRRRQNEFSDQNIKTIIEALHCDSEYSKEVSIKELRENEYNLSLSRYTQEKISFDNGVAFESVIKSITRGVPCNARELDEMASENVTNMQYLPLANIKNGMIDKKLPYLSKIEPKYEKYCLKNNNLLISKNGYPYKIAVASIKEGEQILANANLYVIELDEKKANPYYINAFFDSEQGEKVLKNITVGATVLNIGVDKLKKVEIPLPPMEIQERVARKYQATIQEIAMLELRMEKAINQLHRIFDEESE